MRYGAERLVRSSRRHIEIVPAALLRYGNLSGDEIVGVLECERAKYQGSPG